MDVLRAVDAKTYKRNDLPGKPSRIGFVAQDIESAIPEEWTNLVGESVNDAGQTIKDLDYAPHCHPLGLLQELRRQGRAA